MNACQQLIDNKEALRALGLVAVLAWEAWLGKTDKVQAGSTLELIFNLLKPKSTEDGGNGKGV